MHQSSQHSDKMNWHSTYGNYGVKQLALNRYVGRTFCPRPPEQTKAEIERRFCALVGDEFSKNALTHQSLRLALLYVERLNDPFHHPWEIRFHKNSEVGAVHDAPVVESINQA